MDSSTLERHTGNWTLWQIGGRIVTIGKTRTTATHGVSWVALPALVGATTTAVAVSGWAAAHRELARRERALRAERTDELTGLWTRRTWMAITRDQVAVPDQQGLWLGMVDVDDLKPVNDYLGHPAGDSVLKAIAYRLTTTLPTPVCVGRIGGDEFGVLVTNPSEGWRQQLDAALAEPVQLVPDDPSSELPVRASLGTVSVPPSGADVTDLLARADEHLYQAKVGHRHDGRPADPDTGPVAPWLRAATEPHANQYTTFASIHG